MIGGIEQGSGEVQHYMCSRTLCEIVVSKHSLVANDSILPNFFGGNEVLRHKASHLHSSGAHFGFNM